MERGYFITGTDTEVGKTYVTRLLLRQLAAQGLACAALKPVASGASVTPEGLRNDDALQLRQAASVKLPYEDINPYCFAPPIAPHLAAAQADAVIDLQHIAGIAQRVAAQVEILLVEGVGGWYVPLGTQTSVADLALRLAYPVILVVGMRLGCLNHALLSARAIEDTGLPLAGWIANPVDPDMAAFEDNLAALKTRIDAPCLGTLVRDASLDLRCNARAIRLP